MKARAQLTVERDARGCSVVRELSSAAPLTLMPRRTARRAAVVHLVGSATSPLGGDELDLRVRVGPGARLLLRGIAATLALPGQRQGASRSSVHIEVADGGTLEYLPEHTVVTRHADHVAEVRLDLGAQARARCREILVLGRSGEPPGSLRAGTHLVREDVPLLRQVLELGDARLRASSGYLTGARVVAGESVVWNRDPAASCSGEWWSLTPLAAGGAMATALAADAVTARHRLAEAVRHHPDGAEFAERY